MPQLSYNRYLGGEGNTGTLLFPLFQEAMTGMITGIEDFIRANAPVALDMPPATYDEFFTAPWAKDREHEKKHRELTKSIGETLRGNFL